MRNKKVKQKLRTTVGQKIKKMQANKMNQFHGFFLDIFHFVKVNFYGKYSKKFREIDLFDFTSFLFWPGLF